MRRSVLAGLTGSTLLHGALVAGLLLLVPRAEQLAPLFVDLTQEERPPGNEGGGGRSAHPGRTVSAGRAGAGPVVPPAAPASSPPGSERTASQPETPPASVTPALPTAAAPAPEYPAPSEPAPAPVLPLPSVPAPAPRFPAPSGLEPAPVSAPPKVSAPDAAGLTAATVPGMSSVPSAPAASSVTDGANSSFDTAPIGAHGGDTAGGTSGRPARAGSGDGLSSAAAGGSGAGLERPGSGLAVAGPGERAGDPGAAYAVYLGRLRQRVYEALRYPATARRRGLTGTVVLELTVRPDGAIGRVVVVDSSSHATLDQAAVESVRSLRPQPFPADLPSRTLHVRLPVVFELQ